MRAAVSITFSIPPHVFFSLMVIFVFVHSCSLWFCDPYVRSAVLLCEAVGQASFFREDIDVAKLNMRPFHGACFCHNLHLLPYLVCARFDKNRSGLTSAALRPFVEDPTLSPAQVRRVAACMVWVSRWVLVLTAFGLPLVHCTSRSWYSCFDCLRVW